jgi:stress response protein SCP2
LGKSTVKLVTGSNAGLNQAAAVKIVVNCKQSPADLDLSCFMVKADGKVPSDDYFVFYNQPADPQRIVQFTQLDAYNGEFLINLQALQASDIQKCVFGVTLDGIGTFADVRGLNISANTTDTELVYEVNEGSAETSLVLAELYRHSSGFKLRAVGRGFHGGLKPLAEAHGVVVEDEEEASTNHVQSNIARAETASASAAPQPPVQQQAKVNLTKIDLLKQKVVVSLRKKNIEHEKARVAVVFDASGSMYSLYQNGVVQRAFERVLAVAASMDDDGMLDVWFFGSKCARKPSVSERDFEDYVKRTYPLPKATGGLGAGNNEPLVMEDIIKKYTKEAPSGIPTYIVFFSDGGIYETAKISKLLFRSSKANIFWQFVGLGNADFGVLRHLDDLRGRFLDNADFFALDDLDRVSDEELYDRLFNEYPEWLRQAKAKGIVRAT